MSPSLTREEARNMETTVTVCSSCLTAACWLGEFYCQDYLTAGTVEKTREELAALDREHPSYWERPNG